MQVSISDTLTIQNRIAKALGPALKNVGQLVFLGARRGCIELIYSAPRGVMDSVDSKLTNADISEPIVLNIGKRLADLEAEGIQSLSGPPGKPKAIKDLITNDAITLDWCEPDYRGFHPIQCYYIHYRSVNDSPRRWKTIITNDPGTQFEIKKLPSNRTPFIFKLQAVSEIGIGLESKK